MKKLHSLALAAAALLGLGAGAPGMTSVEVSNNAPIQAPARPFEKTVTRAVTYYVPKRRAPKWRGKIRRALDTMFGGKITGSMRNRWHRRAIAKAALDGRGQAVEGWASTASGPLMRRTGQLANGSPVGVRTTRRALAGAKRAAWFRGQLKRADIAACGGIEHVS